MHNPNRPRKPLPLPARIQKAKGPELREILEEHPDARTLVEAEVERRVENHARRLRAAAGLHR